MASGRHTDALRAQLKLINEWKEERALIAIQPHEGENADEVAESFFGGGSFTDMETGRQITFKDDEDEYLDQFAMDAVWNLERADTYFVTNEMCQVIKHATDTMPSGEVLHSTDLLTKSGFVFYETPINYWGHGVVKAVMWNPSDVTLPDGSVHNGISMWLWRHPRLDSRRGVRTVDGFAPIDDDTYADEVRTNDLALIATRGWAFNAEWQENPDVESDTWLATYATDREQDLGDTHPSAAAFKRLMLTTWRVMSELVWIVPAQRQTRRMAERKTDMKNPGEIRVVQLRRADYQQVRHNGPDDERTRRGYDHRWEVRGHWRDQWYPSEGVHKKIWITKYIKGPDDKPLVLKDRIFKLER